MPQENVVGSSGFFAPIGAGCATGATGPAARPGGEHRSLKKAIDRKDGVERIGLARVSWKSAGDAVPFPALVASNHPLT
jgi:hypothetical protein